MSACFSAIPRATAQPAVDFKDAVVFESGDQPQAIVIADFIDDDGYPDLAVANKGEQTDEPSVSVFQNTQDWTPTSDGLDLVATKSLNSYPTRIEAADMGSAADSPSPDGHIDLIVLMPYDSIYGTPPQLAILYGDGNGNFSDPHYIAFDSNTDYACGLAVYDFDADGRTDIACAAAHGFDINARPHTEVLWRESSGGVTRQIINVPSVSSVSGGTDIVAAEFKTRVYTPGSPLIKDLVMGMDFDVNQVFVLINDGSRNWTTSRQADKHYLVMDAGKLQSGKNTSVVGSDFTDNPHQFHVLLNNGTNGTFSYGDAYEYNPPAERAYGVAIGKINRDGYGDVVVAIPASASDPQGQYGLCAGNDGDGHGGIAVYVGNGDGTLDNPPYLFCTSLNDDQTPKPCFVEIADMNQDGLNDVAVSNTDDDTLAIMINESPAP